MIISSAPFFARRAAVPAITSTSTASGVSGSAFSFTPTSTGGFGTKTWTSGTLPTGLTLNSSTGNISGTPSGTGATNFNLTVTDSLGANATQSFTITITAGVIAVATSTVAGSMYNTTNGTSWSLITLPAGAASHAFTSVATDGSNFVAVSGLAVGTPAIATGAAAVSGTPIVITTATAHTFVTGQTILIQAVAGNTAANGIWTVTVGSSTTFSLNGSTSNAARTGSTGSIVSGGCAMNSTDGINWNIISQTVGSQTTVSYANGAFYIPTKENYVFKSTTGADGTWTFALTTGTLTASKFLQTNLAFANGIYCTGTNLVDTAVLSTDGVNFATATSNINLGTGSFGAIGSTLFFASTGTIPLSSSSNGTTWTTVSSVSGSVGGTGSVFSNGTAIVTGSSTTGNVASMWRSTNGTTFTAMATSTFNGLSNPVVAGGSQGWLLVNSTKGLWFTADITAPATAGSWTIVTAAAAGLTGAGINAVAIK